MKISGKIPGGYDGNHLIAISSSRILIEFWLTRRKRFICLRPKSTSAREQRCGAFKLFGPGGNDPTDSGAKRVYTSGLASFAIFESYRKRGLHGYGG
ncbi:hypothetical protein STHE1630_00034 [Streptococcus thermophilus CNCM I-1630]|nr:hypothetical protein STHE1630_00034 [Streptococcus thermophilus CNCM I-1630]